MFNISQNTILLQVYLFERLSVWGGGGGGGEDGGGGGGGGYVNNQNTSCNVRLQCQK